MFRKLLLAVIYLTCTLSAGGAKLELINGDRITGDLVKLVDGKLVMQTELAGTIKVDVENIETLSSEMPVSIHFPDGTEINAPVEKAAGGKIRIAGETSEIRQTELADILINPPKKEPPRWKGEVSVGLTYTSGNTNNETYAVSGGLKKETERDTITFAADVYKKKVKPKGTSEKVTTEDWWKTRGKYELNLSDRKYIFGEGRYEVDEVALLDRRIIAGGGFGYKWIKSDIENFSVEGGLSNVYEKYDDGSGSTSNLSASAAYHYDRRINDTFSLKHDTSFFPSTEDISDYYLTTSFELRAMISERLFSNFKILYDYDATPAADREKDDVKYILGIGANF